MSFAKDICDLLVIKEASSQFQGNIEWACFAESEPEPDEYAPINCITVYQSQAIPRLTTESIVGYFYTFQVRTRGTDYTTSITRANLISSKIGFLLKEIINTNVYRNIIANSAPIKIETDQKNRVIHVQNFSVEYNS